MEYHLPHRLDGRNSKMITKRRPGGFFETINELEEHFVPRKSVFKRIQRLTFRQRAQCPGETFASFASALWDLALGCGFGPLQEELVLDQLIEKAEDWRIRKALLLQIDSLTLAKAVALGSQMEAAFRAAPRRLSGIIDQWQQQILGSRNWRRKDCSRHGSLPQRPEKVTVTYRTTCHLCKRKKHSFQDCHSLRPPGVPGPMAPEPVENCTSEGELEEDCSSSAPSTLELEIRGLGQETDEDYFETQSHQSESAQSDIKTEPYESASDSESIASDATRETSLSSYCLSSETEEPWQKYSETKAEITPSELECPRQLGCIQKKVVKVASVLHIPTSKGELEAQATTSKPEEAGVTAQTVPYRITCLGSETSKKDFVSKTEAALVAKAKSMDREAQVCVHSKRLAEGAIAKSNTSTAATKFSWVRANSDSCLALFERLDSPVSSEAVLRCSLPNIPLETNRTWKRNCEALKVMCKSNHIPNVQCNRKNTTEGQKSAVAHICGRKMKCPCLKYKVPLKRPGTKEMKSWHSTPGDVSAQDVRDHTNDCIGLANKLSWSCSKLHPEVSDYECMRENLEKLGDCSQKPLRMGKDTGIKGVLVSTHMVSSKNQLMQAATSHQGTRKNLHNESKIYGLTTKGAGAFAENKSLELSQLPCSSTCNCQRESPSILEGVPTYINAKVIFKKDQAKSEGKIEMNGVSNNLTSQSDIHNVEAQENYLGVRITGNYDTTCGTHASAVSTPVSMKGKCLESQNTEAFLGAHELSRNSGLSIGWEVLDGILISNGKHFIGEQEEIVLPDMSRKSSALKHPSNQERTNVKLVGLERKGGGGGGGDLSTMRDVAESQKSPSIQTNGGKDILPAQTMSDSEFPIRMATKEGEKTIHEEAEGTALVLASVSSCTDSTGTNGKNHHLGTYLSLESSVQTWKGEGDADGLPLESHTTNAEILLIKPRQMNADSNLETVQVTNQQFETTGHMVLDEAMTTNVEQDAYGTADRTQETNIGMCQDAIAGYKTQGNDVYSKQILAKEDTKSCEVPQGRTDLWVENSPPTQLDRGFSVENPKCSSRDSEPTLSTETHGTSVKTDNQDKTTMGLDNISTSSTNSEEMDENILNFLGSNSSFYRAVQRNRKAMAPEKSPKQSKFLSFSKMASFRKTKLMTAESQESIKAKTEPLDVDKRNELEDELRCIQSSSSICALQSKENCLAEYSDDDDLFYERPAGLFNRMSLRKASGSGRTLLDNMGTSSSPILARMKSSQGKVLGSVENNDNESMEYPELRKSSSESDFKRNKNTESKRFRSRLALAHRSFSSFFESKSLEKENSEQSPRFSVKNEKEKARLCQTSWKAFLKVKEADGLKQSAISRSVPMQQSPCPNRSPGSFARRLSKEKQECQNGQVVMKSSGSNVLPTEDDHSDSTGTGDCTAVDTRKKRREASHELNIKCPHSPDYSEKEEAMGDNEDLSFEELWLKSPLSPIDLQSSFSHFTPSCPQLSMYERKDTPCRPMSPKPQSPRTSSQRKGFHYPVRLNSTSLISLGNISMMDNHLEAPERPKTVKPRSSFLVSACSLDHDYLREDSGISSQSQISLNTVSSMGDIIRDEENIQQSQMPSEKRPSEKRGLHCRTRSTQMPLSPQAFSNIENKAWMCPFHAQEGKPKVHTLRRRHEPLYKRFSFDDAWMERNRRRKLVKETQSDRETDSSYLLKDRLKVKMRPSITSPDSFDGLPLKLHLYSQSTPTGLDFVGLRRRTSFPGMGTMHYYIIDTLLLSIPLYFGSF
ncbi:hypothetical protein lerEdw1_007941 [Lerista edwardsae]|nr:hypothetical protein lerEdw1_007941 [Lerista edwardsae]